jgi:N6-adenosine-specific RNA methylase IME4
MKLSEIQLVPEIQALFAENNEYDAIKADIVERGIQDPVKVNKHNQLLAGYTRVKIAQELGLDEAPHIVVNIDGDMSAMMEYAILDNLRRRQLTKLQMVEYGMALEKLYEGRNHRPNKYGQNVRTFEGETRNLVADRLSEQTGEKMSGKTYERLKTIATKAAPEVKEKLNSGELTQQVALELTKVSSDEQKEIIQRYSGELKSKDVIREIKRHEVQKSLNQISQQQPEEINQVYDVIVIDPPWPIRKIERDVSPTQVEFDYPTMPLKSLQELEIPCADNCHVWLWTIQKFLPAAFALLEIWGLRYICTFAWHKPGGFQPFNLPQYNCEFALYARKGSPEFVDLKNFNTCFSAPRGSHSEKPEAFYKMVRRVTSGKRLDMFNRRPIEGFDRWGNEAYVCALCSSLRI